MVALPGVPPPCKELQILAIVHIVPPSADITDTDIGISGQQAGRLTIRYHGDHRRNALVHAVVLDRRERCILVSLGTGDWVIKYRLSINVVADYQTSGALRPGRMEMVAPH